MGLSWPSDDEVIIFNNIIIGFLFSLASVHKWVLVLLLKSAGFPIPAELSMCLFCVFFCCRGWFFFFFFLLFWSSTPSSAFGFDDCESEKGCHVCLNIPWGGARLQAIYTVHPVDPTTDGWVLWKCDTGENGRKCLPVILVHVVGDVLFNGLV